MMLKIARANEEAPNAAKDQSMADERVLLNRSPQTHPYRLFCITFSGAYFGLNQCIEIDSIRYAIDALLLGKTIDSEQHRWMLLALCEMRQTVLVQILGLHLYFRIARGKAQNCGDRLNPGGLG